MLHFWFFCRVFPSHTRRTRPLRMRERANWREIAPSCHDSAAVEWHFPVKSGNLVKPGQSNSHATTLAARGSPTGGRTTIGWPRRVCTAAVSALPPESGTSTTVGHLWHTHSPETTERRGKPLPIEYVVKDEHLLSLDGILGRLGRIRVQPIYGRPAGPALCHDDIILYGSVLPTRAHFPPIFWTVDNLLVDDDKMFPPKSPRGERRERRGKPRLCCSVTTYQQRRERHGSIVAPLQRG